MIYQITEQNHRTCKTRDIAQEGAPDAREALMSRRLALPDWANGQTVHVCDDDTAFIAHPTDPDVLISADPLTD